MVGWMVGWLDGWLVANMSLCLSWNGMSLCSLPLKTMGIIGYDTRGQSSHPNVPGYARSKHGGFSLVKNNNNNVTFIRLFFNAWVFTEFLYRLVRFT